MPFRTSRRASPVSWLTEFQARVRSTMLKSMAPTAPPKSKATISMGGGGPRLSWISPAR